jgi:intracellular septation protein
MKLFFDIAPLAVFFLTFKLYGLMVATASLMAMTTIAIPAMYLKEKKVPIALLLTALLVLIFGGLTLVLQDDQFIKMKPTFIYLIFSIILLGGYLCNKGLLKPLMGQAITMPDHAWRRFSLHWGLFFIALAVANEIIWRTLPTDIWVQCKVFGFTGVLLVFTLCHIPFITKHTNSMPKQ